MWQLQKAKNGHGPALAHCLSKSVKNRFDLYKLELLWNSNKLMSHKTHILVLREQRKKTYLKWPKWNRSEIQCTLAWTMSVTPKKGDDLFIWRTKVVFSSFRCAWNESWAKWGVRWRYIIAIVSTVAFLSCVIHTQPMHFQNNLRCNQSNSRESAAKMSVQNAKLAKIAGELCATCKAYWDVCKLGLNCA